METLNNYITGRIIIAERIRIDNIKPGFPVDGTPDEMVKFLKMNGFEEIKDPHSGFYEASIFLNAKHGKYFSVDGRGSRVFGLEFVDTSKEKISVNNPLYYIDMDMEKRTNGKPVAKFMGGNSMSYLFHLTPDEFKKEMETYFG